MRKGLRSVLIWILIRTHGRHTNALKNDGISNGRLVNAHAHVWHSHRDSMRRNWLTTKYYCAQSERRKYQQQKRKMEREDGPATTSSSIHHCYSTDDFAPLYSHVVFDSWTVHELWLRAPYSTIRFDCLEMMYFCMWRSWTKKSTAKKRARV